MRISTAQASALRDLVEQAIRSEHHIRRDFDYVLCGPRDARLQSLIDLRSALTPRPSLLRRWLSALSAVREFHDYASRRYG